MTESSERMWSEEKLCKKILFIVPYPIDKAPSQRLKFEQYYPCFIRNGFTVSHDPFMSNKMWAVVYKKRSYLPKFYFTISGYLRRVRLLFWIRKYDIVYVHLWCTPFGMPVYEWFVQKLARKLIYDIDDLIFLKNIRHENKITSLLKGKSKPVFLMGAANHVITCTPYLDAIAKKYNSHTTDISSTIDTSTYIPVNTYKNDHRLIIGWSGSHSTSRYLYLLEGVLLKLSEILDFTLLVIGDSSFNLQGIHVEAIEWSKETEVTELQRIDIGLYPLPEDDEWVLGKSGLKALQYMALGIPAIATDIGCNKRIIDHTENGYLTCSQSDWLKYIMLLAENPALRNELGMKARKKVVDNYSVAANEKFYLEILKKCI